jgi:thioester reductase-like protein
MPGHPSSAPTSSTFSPPHDLAGCLTHWAEEQPDACFAAFWDGDGRQIDSYTYAQFESRTRGLAHYFARVLKIARGDRVLLAYPPGLEFAAAFMGCARAGIIPVPVCPPVPSHSTAHARKLLAIAADCEASIVFTTTAGTVWLESRGAATSVERTSTRDLRALTWITTDDARGPAPAGFSDTPGEVLFLQYTSGSTSEPKGVIVSHDTVVRNGLATLDHTPIGVSWLPQYHDMGLIGYCLYPIVTGGTTHCLAPLDFLRRPVSWFELVTRVKATCTSAPNFGLEYCLRPGKIRPGDLHACDLRSLRFLMNASEPVSPDTHRRFFDAFAPHGLRREALIVSYGLAENTLAVTHGGRRIVSVARAALHNGRAIDVDAAESAAGESNKASSDVQTDRIELVSCGTPVEGVDVRIVAPESRSVVADHHVGEIWVAGSSACSGYWSNPELSGTTFQNTLPTSRQRFIRTGDLGFFDRGELFVCGRAKDVIIKRGRNYYPTDIERTVARLCQGARHAAVAAIGGQTHDSLIVIVEAKRASDLPDLADIARTIAVTNDIAPDRIVIARPGAIVRTTSGKLARTATRRRWLAGDIKEVLAYAPPDEHGSGSGHAGRRERIAKTLSTCVRPGKEDCTLAEAGIDSLTLVTLVLDLEQYLAEAMSKIGKDAIEVDGSVIQGCTVSQLRGLLDRSDSSPRELAAAIETLVADIRTTRHRADHARMRGDSQLSLPATHIHHARSDEHQTSHVLLTGATGFFGPFLLHALLTLTPYSYSIVMRARDRHAGLERVRTALRQALLWSPALDEEITRRVAVVPGDISERGLGLSSATWRALADSTDTIVHNAAEVNYVASYDTLKPANVDGTRELLRLSCEQRPKEFHFVSSTVIFGWTTASEVTETECNAEMAHLEFGYAQTKWVAEQLVLDARRHGIRTFVYRPSFISASTGGVASKDDIVMRLLAFMINQRIAVRSLNQVSFLPADLVAHNIAAIVRDPRRPPEMLHVTADAYYNMMDVTQTLTRTYGYEFDYFDIADFVVELRRRCREHDPMYPLLDFFTRFHEKLAAMQHKRYSNMHYRLARHHTEAARPEPSLEETVAYLRTALLRERAIAH